MITGDTPTVSQLRKYHANRWKHIYKYLKNYLKEKDNDSLHDARVEIKKLNALSHLLEFGDKSFGGEKELKPVEKIFKLSGKLRDYKNAVKFSKAYQLKHIGLKPRGKKQPGIRKKLKRNLKKYDRRLDKIEKETHVELKKTEAPKFIDPYLSKLKKEIINNTVQNITPRKLHEIRKKAKELTFLKKYDTINLISKTEADMLDELQKAIGDLHDIDKFYKKTIDHIRNKKQKPSLGEVARERQKLFARSKNLLATYSSKKII